MLSKKYIPLLKTTDAELKGYAQLDDKIKDKILPLFELTKSRKTKSSPYGSIEKRMEKLKEIVQERPFILDLTSHEDMMNVQIDNLLDESNGFENWRDFLSSHKEFNIIPVIHVIPDDIDQTKALVKWLEQQNYEHYALKVESYDNDTFSYVSSIAEAIGSLSKLILIIDAGFIETDSHPAKAQQCINRCNELTGIEIGNIAILSSSFPKSVKGHTPLCLDHRGEFPKLDKALQDTVCTSTGIPLVYGDYASIHPIRYNIGGGGWVPRVDFPTSDSYIYTRYRREEGGYALAAEKMLQEPRFEVINCWGNNEIHVAASGTPNGLSPSYWIAVRLNLHITREVLRLDP